MQEERPSPRECLFQWRLPYVQSHQVESYSQQQLLGEGGGASPLLTPRDCTIVAVDESDLRGSEVETRNENSRSHIEQITQQQGAEHSAEALPGDTLPSPPISGSQQPQCPLEENDFEDMPLLMRLAMREKAKSRY